MKKNKLTIAIIGYGFVGKSVDFGFSKNVEKILIDPLLGTKVEDLENKNIDAIFLCLPTPMNDDGSQDFQIFREVLLSLKKISYDDLIILKSTVLPNHLEEITKDFNHVVVNPEFLRERYANEDFINSSSILLSGSNEDIRRVENIYIENSICKNFNFINTDHMTCILVKYAVNCFLSTKVIFFNEMFDLFKEINTEDTWENFIEFVSSDERIGKSHMNVPGHDGKKGFGGACFPKDTAALINFSKNLDADLSLLNQTVKKNNKIRSTYDDLDAREKDQNISFKKT